MKMPIKIITPLILLIGIVLLQSCGGDNDITEKNELCDEDFCNNQTTDSLRLDSFEAIIGIGLNGDHVMISDSGLDYYTCNTEILDSIETTKIVTVEGFLKKKCDNNPLKIRLLNLRIKKHCPIIPDTIKVQFDFIRNWNFVGKLNADTIQYSPCESVNMFVDLSVNADDSASFGHNMKLQNAKNYELGKFNILNDSLILFDSNFGTTLSIGTQSQADYEVDINSFFFNSDTILYKIDFNFLTLINQNTDDKIFFYTSQ